MARIQFDGRDLFGFWFPRIWRDEYDCAIDGMPIDDEEEYDYGWKPQKVCVRRFWTLEWFGVGCMWGAVIAYDKSVDK